MDGDVGEVATFLQMGSPPPPPWRATSQRHHPALCFVG